MDTQLIKSIIKKRIVTYAIFYLCPLFVSLFFVGFRFDGTWAIYINGLVLLYWPVLVPIGIADEYRRVKKNQ